MSKQTGYTTPASAGKSDITLVSSDGISFNLHLKHLEVASDLINDMLESATKESTTEPVQLVLTDPKSETAAVLNLVCPFFYNVDLPVLENESFDILTGMLEWGDKWATAKVIQASAGSLAAQLPTDAKQSFEIYELACRVDNDKLRTASRDQASRYEPFIKTPFDYLPTLGIKGCQNLYDQHLLNLAEQSIKAATKVETLLKDAHAHALHCEQYKYKTLQSNYEVLYKAATDSLSSPNSQKLRQSPFADVEGNPRARLREVLKTELLFD